MHVPWCCDLLPNTKTGQNLEYQLSKSSTPSALVYGEAQAAESKADFIHKMKVVLKEISPEDSFGENQGSICE